MDELLHHDAIIRERIVGKSVRAIAQDHGCSIAEVNKALDLFAVATINAKVRTHTLALELSRLDELQSVFYERAKAGDVASGMLLTKIMERRSCLLGLNSPVRVDAQLLIDGEQARQQPTSTERIRAAIDRIRNVPKPN